MVKVFLLNSFSPSEVGLKPHLPLLLFRQSQLSYLFASIVYTFMIYMFLMLIVGKQLSLGFYT